MISETENVEIKKVNMEGVPEQLVFGLDIGTRSIVEQLDIVTQRDLL